MENNTNSKNVRIGENHIGIVINYKGNLYALAIDLDSPDIEENIKYSSIEAILKLRELKDGRN